MNLRSKLKVRIEGDIENESCSSTWVDPKIDFKPFPDPKNSPFGLQKFKKDPKIKSKWKVRIEENIELNSCSTTLLAPKQFLNPTPTPIKAHKGFKK